MPPNTSSTPLRWQTLTGIHADSSEMLVGPRPYTTACVLLKQPDKQNACSDGEHWLLLGSSVQHPGRSFHYRAGQPRGGKEPQGPQDRSQGCRTSGRPPETRPYPRQLYPAQTHSRPARSNSPTTAIDTRCDARAKPDRKTSGTRERQNWKCSQRCIWCFRTEYVVSSARGENNGRRDRSFGARSSKIRAVCANQRPYGSARGVSGDWYPYRDRKLRLLPGKSVNPCRHSSTNLWSTGELGDQA